MTHTHTYIYMDTYSTIIYASSEYSQTKELDGPVTGMLRLLGSPNCFGGGRLFLFLRQLCQLLNRGDHVCLSHQKSSGVPLKNGDHLTFPQPGWTCGVKCFSKKTCWSRITHKKGLFNDPNIMLYNNSGDIFSVTNIPHWCYAHMDSHQFLKL